MTYGTGGYKAVFPDYVEVGRITIDYDDIVSDAIKDEQEFIMDREFVFEGVHLTQQYDGDEGFIIRTDDGTDILYGDLDISKFVLDDVEKVFDGSTEENGVTEKDYDIILSVSGTLGFAPYKKKELKEALGDYRGGKF